VDNLKIGLASVIEIFVGFITKILCWMPHNLMSEIKRARLETCQRLLACLLSCFKSKVDDFLCSIVRGDKEFGVSV
jgi:hypothetical protein